MARLLIQTEGFYNQVVHLRMGLNKVGRSPANDVQIEHPTISAQHCELILNADGVVVRDCDSTNGTFIDGSAVASGRLASGQVLRLGDVELLVESTEVNVAIPKFELPCSAPPVMLHDGGVMCNRHRHARATHQCTHCLEVLCEQCVHRLRRRGGKVLKLCPLCSHTCEPLGGEKKKKKSLFGFLQRTVKLPFLHNSKSAE